jgi:hypothetical protein
MRAAAISVAISLVEVMVDSGVPLLYTQRA